MIYLASKSPRRGELLDQLGVDYHLLDVDVDETPLAGESPGQYVTRLAVAKAEAGWVLSQKGDALPVIGADTCIAINDMILGKPKGADHGFDMLKRLSGRTHDVYCAVSIAGMNEQHTGAVQILKALNHSQVTFREMADDEIRDYWCTGEPQGKAGAYAIQGIAAKFVKHLSGSYSAVVGLPLFETAELLRDFAINID